MKIEQDGTETWVLHCLQMVVLADARSLSNLASLYFVIVFADTQWMVLLAQPQNDEVLSTCSTQCYHML